MRKSRNDQVLRARALRRELAAVVRYAEDLENNLTATQARCTSMLLALRAAAAYLDVPPASRILREEAALRDTVRAAIDAKPPTSAT